MFLTLENTINAAGEFQASNLWDVKFEFNKESGIVMPDDVLFKLKSADAPTQELTTKSATLSRYEISQPATVKRHGEMKFTFVENEDAKVSKLWEQMIKTMWSMSGDNITGASLGWKKLKGTVYCYYLNSRGERTQGFKLMHCFFKPTNSQSGFSDSADDPIELELGVEYNWWVFLDK